MQNLNVDSHKQDPRSNRKRRNHPKIILQLVLILSFVAFLVGGAYLTLSSEKRDISDMENRKLAQSPDSPTFAHIMSGSYMKQTESFVTDQIFNRDAWISLNAFLNKDVFKQTVKNGIYVSDDGTMESPMKESIDTDTLVNDLTTFTSRLEERGTEVYFGLAPNKASMASVEPHMPDYMGNEAPRIYQTVRDQLSTVPGLNVMDYRKSLNEAQQLSDVFFKTDYHWNMNGAYAAYAQTVNTMSKNHPEMGLTLKPNQLRTKTHEQPYYGSYARSTTLQYVKDGDTFEWMVPKEGFTPSSVCFNRATPCKPITSIINKKPLKSEETYTEMYSLFLHRNWPIVTMDQEQPVNDTRTLILKDSYANPMLTLLPEHFGHVSVIDVRHFEESTIETYVNENDIDVVLFIHNVNLNEFVDLYHEKLNEPT